MAVQTVTLHGEKFVLIPKSEYLALKQSTKRLRLGVRRERQSAEDAADCAEIERLRADPTQKPIPWAEARKRLL